MSRLSKKTVKKPGLSPGTLIHVGEKKMEKPRIRVIDYDYENLQELELESIEQCIQFKDSKGISWINIDGLHDMNVIDKIGKHFQLHPLMLEDIVHTTQRPKAEDYGEHVYIVLKMLLYNPGEQEITTEQFSIILGPKYVISFQEKVGDVFEPIRERIRKKNQRIRNNGADYLIYALIDAIIDNYFLIIEEIDEAIEKLDEAVMDNADQSVLSEIYRHKKNLILMRKAVGPVREMLNTLVRDEFALIDEKFDVYFRDTYDHIIRVIETIDNHREMLASMLENFRSIASNKMNEIMKVLTIIATIFIPLTFIAGVYGMNFKFMPELEWNWGYPVAVTVMVGVAIVMMIFFRRKNWL